MTWVATENFEDYTITQNLDTRNGGSGWSAAWSNIGASGSQVIVATPSGGQGSNATRANEVTGTNNYGRTFSAISAGTVSFMMQLSITNPSDFIGIILYENATDGRMYIRFGPTGNIEIFNNDVAGYQSIQAYSANTWYTIEIDFDDSAQPNLYRARVNGGSYTAYKTVNGGAYTNVNQFRLDDSATNAHEWFIDDIKPGAAEAAAALVGSSPMMFVRRQD